MDLEDGIMPVPETESALRNEPSACILMFHGTDHKDEIHKVLMDEWELVPLMHQRQKVLDAMDGRTDKTKQFLLVYISFFFEDQTDFLYYVRGQANMSKFLMATWSGKANDRPCFAMPVISNTLLNTVFTLAKAKKISSEHVSRTETRGLRWTFLYRSAVRAWGQLEFSVEKLVEIAMFDDIPTDEESVADSDKTVEDDT